MSAPLDTSVHVQRALDGAADSLEWLVERFAASLLAQAHYRMGPVLRRFVDPEDLVQDVWAIALAKLAELDRDVTNQTRVLLKFLSAILLNRVNQVLRAQIRTAGSADPGAVLDPRSRTVVTSIVRREAMSEALVAIETLPESEREVLILRVLEQRSAADVAELLGITTSLVYVRQHRALRALRQRLPRSLFDELASDDADGGEG